MRPPRAEEAEGPYADLDVPGRRTLWGPSPRSARSGWSDHPSPGSGLGCPLPLSAASRPPRAPLRPRSSLGEAAGFWGQPGAMPRARAAGLKGRRASPGEAGRQGGGRGHLSARLSRGVGQPLPGPGECERRRPGRGFRGRRGTEEGRRERRRAEHHRAAWESAPWESAWS